MHAAAKALGYIPNSAARTIRQQASGIVGLVVPDIANPFYGMAARSFAETLALSERQLILAVTEDDPQLEYRHVLALRSARVSGIAITLTACPLPETLTLLAGIPAIQLFRRARNGPAASVVMNDRGGVREATQHLLALGHRRIGFVGTPRELSTGSARLRGFSDAMKAHGVPVHKALLRFGTPRPDFGRVAVDELWSGASKPPTALIVASPQQTLGVVEALHQRSVSIPDDVSLYQLRGCGLVPRMRTGDYSGPFAHRGGGIAGDGAFIGGIRHANVNDGDALRGSRRDAATVADRARYDGARGGAQNEREIFGYSALQANIG